MKASICAYCGIKIYAWTTLDDGTELWAHWSNAVASCDFDDPMTSTYATPIFHVDPMLNEVLR